MKDYRFDMQAYALRKENSKVYALSRQASEDLRGNSQGPEEYSEDMWDDFWAELNKEFGEKYL